MNEEQSKQIIESNYEESKEIIQDQDKVESLISKVEDKIKKFPGIGNQLADLVTMIDLVRMYFLKEYKEVPVGTIIAIIAALLYWVSPVDLIPDTILGLGIVDDLAVLTYCAKMINEDLDTFRKWRDYK